MRGPGCAGCIAENATSTSVSAMCKVLGHVQSYGLTRIQARHCDAHDQMLEKAGAFERFSREMAAKLPKRGFRSDQRKAAPNAVSAH